MFGNIKTLNGPASEHPFNRAVRNDTNEKERAAVEAAKARVASR